MTIATTPRACLLFDLDGTMLDTDQLHLRAWNAVLGGAPLDEAFYRAHIMGLPNVRITSLLRPEAGAKERQELADAKEAHFRSLLGSSAAPLPGLSRLLDAAEEAGVGMAVVTNAPRPNAEAMLHGLGWATRFPVLVIGEEVARPKPDPMPYLVALERLGGSAASSIAFEDSHAGMLAAAGSGAFTVGIATSLEAEELLAAGAGLVVRDYTDPRLVCWLREHAGLVLA